MPETQSTSVGEFITRCIEAGGGVVEARPGGVFDVLLSDGLAGAAGGRSLVSLAMTAEALASARDAEPAMIGSPFLDALIGFASGRGVTAMGRLDPGQVKRKGLRETLEEELTFANCRVRFDETSIRIRDGFYVLFDFRLTYISDERRERLATIPVDVESRQVNGRLGERLPELKILPCEPPPTGAISDAGIAAAYERAKEVVAARAREEGLGYQVRLSKRFDVEQARISDYYRQIHQDLMRRAEGEQQEEKRDALRSKMEVARKEEHAKIREIGEKYRIRPHAALTSARLVAQEKTFFTVHIDRGSTTRPLELRYDSLLQRIDLPACEQCGRETARIYVNPASLRLCPACAGKA